MSLNVAGVVKLLQVFDMPTSLRFYRDLLGFQLIQQSQPGDDCGWAWLRLNDAELMLNTAYESENRPSTPDPARVSAHEDTVLFFGCPDVDGAYSSLQALGVSASAPTTAPYGMRQISFRDPDGYGICLQWKAL
ncbi:MAG: VOC family protein [Planctomycetes bacterium]|nr:VOC family protein [Planctomycetota bacterium]